MNKQLVYLSFAMEFADTNQSMIRAESIAVQLKDMGFDVFNPHTDEEIKSVMLKKYNCLDMNDLKEKDYDSYLDLIADLRWTDCELIANRTQFVLAVVDNCFSGGMAGELTLADYLGIPVYLVVSKENEKIMSSWTRSCANVTFSTIEECLAFIKKHKEENL